jgi:membrane-bound lytic murein transglycosylase B
MTSTQRAHTRSFLRRVILLATTGAYLASATGGLCDQEDASGHISTVQLAASTTLSPEQRPVSLYRGWDYLVERLRLHGVAEPDISAIYSNPEMPYFTFVPFKLRPRESHSIYSGFIASKHFKLGANFIRQHLHQFGLMQRKLGVPREVVAAILVVESQIGRNTGKEMIFYRLSRVSSAADPENVRRNFELLREQDPSISLPAVEERAKYLEETFLPEIPALIEIGKRNKISALRIRGSIAGAFGFPQFLPSAFLRYGIDGNRDGLVSLYNEVDALWSAANYLASFGYRRELPLSERRAILWRYNKSDAYIDTIVAVSEGIDRELVSAPR